jgi:cytochrome c
MTWSLLLGKVLFIQGGGEVNKSILLMLMCSIFVASGIALAAGNAAKGKALFNNPKFAGATSGRSCNTCHPDGKGLKQAGSKKEFHIAGEAQNSLEDAVNACIINAIAGKAIDPESAEMQDIVAYIRSLRS